MGVRKISGRCYRRGESLVTDLHCISSPLGGINLGNFLLHVVELSLNSVNILVICVARAHVVKRQLRCVLGSLFYKRLCKYLQTNNIGVPNTFLVHNKLLVCFTLQHSINAAIQRVLSVRGLRDCDR